MARTIVIPLSEEEILEIKNFIKHYGFSQDKLGVKLGVKRGTVSGWFRRNLIATEGRTRLMELIHTYVGSSEGIMEAYPALYKGTRPEQRLSNHGSQNLEAVKTEDLVNELQGRGWTVTLTKSPE